MNKNLKQICLISALFAISGCQTFKDDKEEKPLLAEETSSEEMADSPPSIPLSPFIDIDLTKKDNRKDQDHWLNRAIKGLKSDDFKQTTFLASPKYSFSTLLKAQKLPYAW